MRKRAVNALENTRRIRKRKKTKGTAEVLQVSRINVDTETNVAPARNHLAGIVTDVSMVDTVVAGTAFAAEVRAEKVIENIDDDLARVILHRPKSVRDKLT